MWIIYEKHDSWPKEHSPAFTLTFGPLKEALGVQQINDDAEVEAFESNGQDRLYFASTG